MISIVSAIRSAFERIKGAPWAEATTSPPSDDLETTENQQQPTPLKYSYQNDIPWPGSGASLRDHVQYLINCRDYIKSHPIPEGTNYRQYRHNPDGRDVGDVTQPAITDCCYDYFKTKKLLSVGFPLFVHSNDDIFDFDAGIVEENGKKKIKIYEDIKFSRPLFQESMHKLFYHLMGDDSLVSATSKIGYQSGTHFYFEVSASSDRTRLLGRAIIDELVHSTKTNADDLLKDIERRLTPAHPSHDVLSNTAPHRAL